MGMGNAFTAVSDDADAVFYNPAGMATYRSYDLRFPSPKYDFGVDDYNIVRDLVASGASVSGTTISKVFGKHLYGDIGVFPALVFPGFTLGFLYKVRGHLLAQNLTFPSVDMLYTKDVGIVGGFAHEFRGLFKKHYLRVGLNVKMLTRSGFHQTLPLATLLTANTALFKSLASSSGKGIGVGAGIQYEIAISRLNEVVLGAAYQDIGDTSFGGSYKANRPPSIRGNFSMGVMYSNKLSRDPNSTQGLKISAEARHLNERGIDPRLRAHLGAEFDFGIISLQGGLNQDSITYGVSAQIWGFEWSAVSYGVENQSLAFLDRERRYMLELKTSFDLMGKAGSRQKEADRKKHPRDYN